MNWKKVNKIYRYFANFCYFILFCTLAVHTEKRIEFSKDSSRGKILYTQKGCGSCHGENGKNPEGNIYPHINNQPEKYLITQMQDIKHGRRENGMTSLMRPVMKNVSEEEIEQIAIFLSQVE